MKFKIYVPHYEASVLLQYLHCIGHPFANLVVRIQKPFWFTGLSVFNMGQD